MSAKRICIDANWGASEFHCPACGAMIMEPRGDFHIVEPCCHLRFFWISMVGAFEWLAPDLDAARLKAIEEDDEADEFTAAEGRAPDDWDAASLCSDSTVVFSFSQTAFGCGPAPYTMEIAIDFNGEAEKEEERAVPPTASSTKRKPKTEVRRQRRSKWSHRRTTASPEGKAVDVRVETRTTRG